MVVPGSSPDTAKNVSFLIPTCYIFDFVLRTMNLNLDIKFVIPTKYWETNAKV